MRMNEKGLALLCEFESCRLKAYQDGGGVWTIGWGHTGDVKPGDKMSQFEADEQLKMDLEEREIILTALLNGIPTTPDQFSAMLSLAYNVGFGNPNSVPPVPGLRTSTVLKRHALGNRIGAANAFLLWNKDNGKFVEGLMRRRESERELYLSEA